VERVGLSTWRWIVAGDGSVLNTNQSRWCGRAP
jgi:hypothetical protein